MISLDYFDNMNLYFYGVSRSEEWINTPAIHDSHQAQLVVLLITGCGESPGGLHTPAVVLQTPEKTQHQPTQLSSIQNCVAFIALEILYGI